MEQNRKSIIYFVLIFSTISYSGAEGNEESKSDVSENRVGKNYPAFLSFLSNESQLYNESNIVNLGQDYSDDQAPRNLRDALTNATNFDPRLNQYSPNNGLPRLLKAIAKMYSKILNKELNPNDNIIATVGATEALHVSFLTLTSPGDEWIVIEPAYNRYIPNIKIAKGIPKFTSLKPTKASGDITGKDWELDRDELESLFNNKTKGILINNPNNPTGKSYTLDELQFVADLAKKWNVTVISDEAHEWITYEPHKQLRIASLPGMFERTITIGSASKTFSVTGWRIGWIYGPAHILNNIKPVHANSVHSSPAPQQEAIAVGFEDEYRNFGKPESYFTSRAKSMRRKRDYMIKSFTDVGMLPSIPDCGNCLLVNWTTVVKNNGVNFENTTDADKGTEFNNWMIKHIGVLGVPSSTYYSDEHKHLGEDFIRYCFHKKNETLQEAVRRLQKLNTGGCTMQFCKA